MVDKNRSTEPDAAESEFLRSSTFEELGYRTGYEQLLHREQCHELGIPCGDHYCAVRDCADHYNQIGA